MKCHLTGEQSFPFHFALCLKNTAAHNLAGSWAGPCLIQNNMLCFLSTYERNGSGMSRSGLYFRRSAFREDLWWTAGRCVFSLASECKRCWHWSQNRRLMGWERCRHPPSQKRRDLALIAAGWHSSLSYSHTSTRWPATTVSWKTGIEAGFLWQSSFMWSLPGVWLSLLTPGFMHSSFAGLLRFYNARNQLQNSVELSIL